MACNVCNNSQYKKKKRRKRIIWLTIVILLAIGIFAYFNNYVNPTIIKTNIAVIKAKTNETINSSITTSLSNKDLYDNLISIKYDADGNITSITANSFNANKINNQILTDCQNKLSNTTDLSFDVALGCFSGVPLLNNIGPKIKIKMLPIGNIQSSFKSSLTSLGINQTYHAIYLNYTVSVSVLLPGFDRNVTISSQILIGESIIVGKVPQVYFGNNSTLNNQLNLAP